MSFKLRELLLEAFENWKNRLTFEKPGLGSTVYRFFKEQLQFAIWKLVRGFGYYDCEVKASVGIGNWAIIPWVGVLKILLIKAHTTQFNGFFVFWHQHLFFTFFTYFFF